MSKISEIKRLELQLAIKQLEVEKVTAECNLINFDLENTRSVADYETKHQSQTDRVVSNQNAQQFVSYMQPQQVVAHEIINPNLLDNTDKFNDINAIAQQNQVDTKTQTIDFDFTNPTPTVADTQPQPTIDLQALKKYID